jgi:hypothetical protein
MKPLAVGETKASRPPLELPDPEIATAYERAAGQNVVGSSRARS